MAAPGNHTLRRARQAPSATRGQTKAITAVAIVGYLLLFFAAPIPEFKSAEHPRGISRGALLTNELLLFDEVVLGHRGPDGEHAADGWLGKPPEFAVFDRLRVLLPALVMLAVCGVTGWLALCLGRVNRGMEPLELLFFSCTVGYSIVSLYTLAIGLAGALHARWLFIAPAAIAMLLGAYRLWQVAAKRRELVRERAAARTEKQHPREPRRAGHWLWWAVPFGLAIVLGGTLTPFEFDVLEYHLQAPKEFYQQGQIDFLPHNVYGNMPLGSEMLSLAAMAALRDWWFGALVGKTVIALAAPLAALGLLAAGRRFVDATTGVVAALVYISIPWIARVSSLGLVEGVSALYLWGTVYAVLLWWRGEPDQRMSRLLLAGFLAGSAAACKYPNVLFVLLPAALVVLVRSWRISAGCQRQGENERKPSAAHFWARLTPLAVFLAAAVLACGPWYAKNWILTGNPVYPLAYGMFDGRTRTVELDEQWRKAHRPPGYRPEQLAESMASIAWRSSWLSPLVLPLAILGVVGSCYRRMALGLAAYALLFIAAWWLFTHRIDRFWVPVSPVLAFLAALSVSPNALVPWRWPVKSLLAGGLTANLVLVVAGGGGDTSYFVSLTRLLEDPARIHYWHRYLNKHLTHDDVLLTVGDAIVFDLNTPVVYSTVFDRDRFEELMKGRTTEERRDKLAKLGVTYVAVDWTEIARYRSPGNYGFTNYIQPELFEELVREQVLDSPLRSADPSENSVGYEVFPVHRASTTEEGPSPRNSPNRSGH